MRAKRYLSALLSVMLIVSLAAFSSSAADDSVFADLPDTLEAGNEVVAVPEMYPDVDMSKSVNVNIYMVSDAPNDWDMIEEAANEYLEPFNTTISATFLPWSDYQTLYSLSLQGDDCDLIYTANWCYLDSEASKGSFVELTDDFLSTYMPLTTKYQAEDSWAEVKVAGKVYCVPQNMTEADQKYVAIRQDLAEKYGVTEMNDWDDYMNYLLTVAEQETPESGIYAYAAATDNNELWDVYREAYNLRLLVDDDYLDFSYHFVDSDTAPDLEDISLVYQTDEFRDYCEDMKTLADAGAWSRGALTNTITAGESFANLQGASLAWNSSVFSYMKTAEETDGIECAAYELSSTPTSAEYGKAGMSIASACKNKERAAMVLDIIKNDTYMNRLLIQGIEGVHYEVVDEEHYAETDEADNYPIWGTAISWVIKNYKLTDAGEDPRQEAIETAIADRAEVSYVRSFSFDDSEISEYSNAIRNILNDYVPSLELGLSEDIDATLDEMMSKLESAGLQIYLDELETQYSAWLAEQ